MRLHRCASVGCRELIKLGYSYCDKHYQERLSNYKAQQAKQDDLMSKTLRGKHDKQLHDRKYNQEVRPELGHDFYTDKRWEKLSEAIKIQRAYTDEVTGKVHDKGEVIVDHIIPRRLCNEDEAYAIDNLWVLSRATHNRKTYLESKMSDNQLKHVSKDWWIKVLTSRST